MPPDYRDPSKRWWNDPGEKERRVAKMKESPGYKRSLAKRTKHAVPGAQADGRIKNVSIGGQRTRARARLVMEAHLGRLLRSDELVHHRNGDPADDRLENLQVVSRSEHARLHIHEHKPWLKAHATHPA